MLKIAYSDTTITLEQLHITAEEMVAQRSTLALRVGQPICVQLGGGSLLLPATMPGIAAFVEAIKGCDQVMVAPCDYGWLEISLPGIWIAATATSEQGILLVVALNVHLEQQLIQLWQQSLAWSVEASSLPKAG
jgi:hypothetical protein